MNQAAQKRSGAARRAALRIGGSVLALGLLLSILPLDELWAAMRRVSPGVWLAAVAVCLAVHILGTLKWRMMVNVGGAGLTIPQAARCHYAGLFGNILLPSVVGGDVIRAGLAVRMARGRAQGTAGVLLGSLLDRLLDIVALVLVAAFGALLVPQALDPRSREIFWMLAGGFAAAGAAGAAAMFLLPARKFSIKTRRRLVKVRRVVRAMARRPHCVALSLAGGAVMQTTFVLLTAWLAAECGLHLPIYVWLFAGPLAKLAATLPVTQGGIGVREIALAALLAPFGATAVQAVAVGLVWETVMISVSLLSGGISLALGGGARIAPADESQVVGKEALLPRS